MEIGPTEAAPPSFSSAAAEPSFSSSAAAQLSLASSSSPESSRNASKCDSDDDEEVCRICRNPSAVDNQLQYPCACRGSIKFVHQDCLLQWLHHSNARKCEVCKHPYSFSPVYADNAPARLPFQEFIVGISMKACHVLQFLLRLSFVLSVWLLIVPSITFWVWQLSFVRSFVEARTLFSNHLSTSVVLNACLHGLLLFASIWFIFYVAYFVIAYAISLLEAGGQDADMANGDRNAAPAVINIAVDGNGEDGRPQERVQFEMRLAQLRVDLEIREDRRDANMLELHGGAVEDIRYYELIGMQGPLLTLVGNALTVLARTIILLVVGIFVPFSLGRIILYYLSWILSSVTSPVLSTAMPLTDSALSLANSPLKNRVLGHAVEILKVNASEQIVMSTYMSSKIARMSWHSDATNLAVGYTFIFFLAIFCLGIVTLVGRFNGIALITETIPYLFRQFVAAMRPLVIMIKVAFLLVIELVVFPLMCGWCLDVCTIKMFGKSVSQRVEFFNVSPLASSSVHWVVGIVYLVQTSMFYGLVREVLLNGVLYFLRNSADHNNNPIHMLKFDPLHKHARTFFWFLAVCWSLIVMLVFLPVKLAMWMVPSIFPLDISVSDPFIEIPVVMILFQICIPFAVEHFKLRNTLKSVLQYWFTAIGWSLGLTDFLLRKAEEDNGGHENGNGDLGRRERALVYRVYRPSTWAFAVRINLLLVVAWMSLLVFNSALIVVPVSLGRTLFNAIPPLPITHGIKCNDLYAFAIGIYVIWTVLAGARYCVELIRTRRTRLLLNQIWKWCGITVKSSALLSIWIFVIPVMIGLLLELLVIVPMRNPTDESPVFLLYKDWAIGLIFLKIWTSLAMLNDSWRVKFERVKEDGFSGLQGLYVLREIVFPITVKLLTALCVPYVLSRGVFPVFGFSLLVNSAVYKFAWLGCLILSLPFFFGKRFRVWFTNLHNSIRDDRYLIGRKLLNYYRENSPDRNEDSTADGIDVDSK